MFVCVCVVYLALYWREPGKWSNEEEEEQGAYTLDIIIYFDVTYYFFSNIITLLSIYLYMIVMNGMSLILYYVHIYITRTIYFYTPVSLFDNKDRGAHFYTHPYFYIYTTTRQLQNYHRLPMRLYGRVIAMCLFWSFSFYMDYNLWLNDWILLIR